MELTQLKINQLKQLAKAWNVQPTGDKRYKQTWIDALEAKRQEIAKQESKPSELTALQALQSLKEAHENYIPLYEYRALVSHLSRKEQDAELYALERNGMIELSSLVEAIHYTSAQIEQGISQGEMLCPLFFAILN
jgi:uncharacterized protein YhaN